MSLHAVQPSPLPVLLIEDEPAVMAYVRAALERSGYPVVCCESGADALRLLEDGSFLGVVSDMRTPGVDVRPLRQMTTAARTISAGNLHDRCGLHKL